MNKQIQSLEAFKNELNSHVALLNDELNKSKTLSSKVVDIEQEKRKLMEENSGIIIKSTKLSLLFTLIKIGTIFCHHSVVMKKMTDLRQFILIFFNYGAK